jgi:pantetheine-phosphate adenylyltransferase/dephospho-CoA kinase
MKKIIGITGCIGAGKSEVVTRLVKYPNILTIDTDSLAKDIAVRSQHRDAIKNILGFVPDFSTKEGRSAIAAKLFSDKDCLIAYQSYIHPLVFQEIMENYSKLADNTIYIVESAIMFETGSEKRYDKVIVVAAEESVRKNRLEHGPRAMKSEDIQKRIDEQIPQSEKIDLADYVITNDGTAEDLDVNVSKLYVQLCDQLKKALFVLSGDPPTLGHEWIIKEAQKKYGNVAVAVTVNPGKNPMFTADERVAMLRELFPIGVQIDAFSGIYSVDYAESIGASIMVRGRRNQIDEIMENTMASFNSEINPSVETVVFDAPSHLTEVSSSAIKLLLGNRGWEHEVSKYVSPSVLIRIIAKQHDLFKKLQKRGAVGNELEFWKTVVSPYLESDRFYHNIKHIGTMIWDFKSVVHLADNPDTIECAIWLHDLYNDTKIPDSENVTSSGIAARQLLHKLGLPEDFVIAVQDLIGVTTHSGYIATRDQEIMVDLDLVILAAFPRVFDLYESNIRKEYAWVPEDLFCQGRIGVLKKIMSKDSVFHTNFFRERYASRATENLERSLEKLNKEL